MIYLEIHSYVSEMYIFIFQAGNHDNSRVASRFSPELVDGINMITLLMPGIGVTYMVSTKFTTNF